MRLLFDDTVMKVLARIALPLAGPRWGLSVDGADILMARLASEEDKGECSGRKLLCPEQNAANFHFRDLYHTVCDRRHRFNC
jgi:hypothetical protein